ncbi:MAG TPA: ABC transporter ATP-binding protein [Baekduia sp.]|nr:ABC transporter ATP-binding protein [Baekduia sp.]
MLREPAGSCEIRLSALSSSAHPTEDPVLQVRGLTVEAPHAPIVEAVDLRLAPGEILGIVGESGSGKTTTALALLGYTTPNAKITSGVVDIAGTTVDLTDERSARACRGRLVSYVPQNPGTSLNPSMRIGAALAEMLRSHRSSPDLERDVPRALASVHLPDGSEFQHRYPHQLSGGQQQRVCISVALACEPPLVVLDEPTTGLDVVTQAMVLNELKRLRSEQGVSMIYVSHDLAAVGQIADRVAVMYAGRIVEEGPTMEILQRPRHPYTSGLVASIPDHLDPRPLEPMPGVAVGVGERPQGCAFSPRCPLRIDQCEAAVPDLAERGMGHLNRCLRPGDVPDLNRAPAEPARVPTRALEPILSVSNLRIEHRDGHETVVAADDVNLALVRGGCVGLIGESGSGKTSTARAIAGLQPFTSGEIVLEGERLADAARKRTREQRRRLQIIFQNPADALNPRTTIGATIGRPARSLRGLSSVKANQEVRRLLELVRLPATMRDRYPSELSGGERQRVGIARALAAEPDLLICDEITSALDVSVQAAVLSLLGDLREELGLAILFITHDLGVVATIADEVVVLERGQVRESGPVVELLHQPKDPYTQKLMASAPSLTHALARVGDR